MFVSFEEWLEHLIPDFTWPLTNFGTPVVLTVAAVLVGLLLWAVH